MPLALLVELSVITAPSQTLRSAWLNDMALSVLPAGLTILPPFISMVLAVFPSIPAALISDINFPVPMTLTLPVIVPSKVMQVPVVSTVISPTAKFPIVCIFNSQPYPVSAARRAAIKLFRLICLISIIPTFGAD